MIRPITITKPLINLMCLHHHLRPIATESTLLQVANPITPVNPAHLLRVCTVLYQQQNSPESKLNNSLNRCEFELTHEFFIQVCNNFSHSWRPVYNFFQFSESHPHFKHTSVTFNKMVDVFGKSRNIELFWEVLTEMVRRHLVTDKTCRVALKTLASARELKKCVEFFHLMNAHEYGYSLETLNKVAETLCRSKLVVEAKHIVLKLKEWVEPNAVTYKYLISGFCDVGNLIEASKVWNVMVDEGFEPDINVVEKMMETLFKTNRFSEAMKLFQWMRSKRLDKLGPSTYRIVINWMCKSGKLAVAREMFGEMHERGIQVDNIAIASLIYGFLSKARVREAYELMEQIEKPDVSVYHGFIKGLLRLRKASEATQVFREMIKRGCEPEMHTYVMLLQGHLGKRGRKGPDPLVNFDTIFVGGIVKAGKSLEAMKYVERVMNRGLEVPRFDYNRFLHYYSNEEGVVMFEEVGKKLRDIGLFDLADIFARYGEKMATKERRRERNKLNREERGEPCPTYPRTYDLLHANGLLSYLTLEGCSMTELLLEMDHILRPEMRWEARVLDLRNGSDQRLLVYQKPFLRK